MKGGGGKGGKTEKGKAADKPGQKKGCHFAGDCLAMIGPFAAMGCTMAHAQISKDRKCDYNS